MPSPRPEIAAAPRRTAPPPRLVDNLAGRAFQPHLVAREIASVLGPEILQRLQRRKAGAA